MKISAKILLGLGIALVVSRVILLFFPSPAPTQTTKTAASPQTPASLSPTGPHADKISKNRSESEWLAILKEKEARGESAEEILAALQEIAQQNPALALRLAETSGRTDEEKGEFLAALASAWAARDPNAAWKWTLAQSARLSSLPGRPPILEKVMEHMAQSDPEGLLAQVDLLLEGSGPAGWDNAGMTGVAMDALIKAGHGALALAAINQWIQGPQKMKVGSDALEAAARYLAQTASPAQAASWLQSLPECTGKGLALSERATAWAGQDPAAAIAWTQQLGDMRSVTMRLVFSQWMRQDINAAIEWLAPQLSTEKPEPVTNRLVDLVVHGCAPEDLPLMADWGQTIPSAALRDATVRQSVRRWAEQDYGAALTYVRQNTQLTPEQRKDLSQYMQDLVRPHSP